MFKKILHSIAKRLEGHFSIGRLTVYGDNAMHFGVTFWTRKYGYICFRLPLPCGIVDHFRYGDKLRWWPLYFYISPNATPWAATFMLGRKHSRDDWALSRIRNIKLGHGFKTEEQYEELRKINNLI